MKAMAAYTIIVGGSKAALGDFIRTQDNFANQTKIFKGQWEDLLAKMGSGPGLKAATGALMMMNDLLFPKKVTITSEMVRLQREVFELGDKIFITAKNLKRFDKDKAPEVLTKRMAGLVRELDIARNQLAGQRLLWAKSRDAAINFGTGATGAVGGVTDEIEIQGASLEALERLRKTVHDQELERFDETLRRFEEEVKAAEKADADMLASFIKMADDELVMWDALNAHALMSLDKQAAAAEAAYTKMAWGADAFGEHLFEVEKTATILTEAEIRKRLLAHGSFVDGVKLGFMDILDSQITWANVGLSVTSNMYSIMQSGLSDAFYTMATDMQDLEGVWEDFTGNILKMFSNMLAQMAVQWAASSIIRTLSGGGLELVGGTAPSIVSTGLQVAGIGSKVAGLFGGGSAAVGSTALLAGAGEVSTAGMMAGMGLGGAGGGGALAGGSAGLGPGLAAAGPYLALAAPVLLGMYLGSKRGRPMTEAERYQEQINRAVQGISDLTLSPSGTSVYGSDANQIFGNLGLDEKQRAEVGKRITINAPLINIEGSLVADENSLNELAEEMDMRLHRLAQLETGI